MIRFQPAWIIESASEAVTSERVFLPYLPRFTQLSWFAHKGIVVEANTPIDSQALLMRSWYAPNHKRLSERNRRKFNQTIKNPFDLDMNPYKTWNDKLFSRNQLDYLFYWKEAAYEMEEVEQREIFWGAVYQIISYWLTSRKYGGPLAQEPDEMMYRVLMKHKESRAHTETKVNVTCRTFDNIHVDDPSLVIFPLSFADEKSDENEIQAVFHAWFHGHADVDQARRDIRHVLKDYQLSYTSDNNLSLFNRLTGNAAATAICWSGHELPPTYFETELIKPFTKAFSEVYTSSKLFMKAVDRTEDSYDYLLLLFDEQ